VSSAVARAETPADTASVLRQLARLHVKRYATHPLYLVAVAFLILTMIQMYDDGPRDWEAFTTPVVVAFFIGVLGVVIGYRLTATEERALDLVDAAPTDATTRTLALCAACIVPVATALVWLVVRLITWALWPIRDGLLDEAGGWGPALAITITGSVVAAAGGPLFGIMAARWVRFPGAGVLAAVVLIVPTWTVGGAAVEPTLYDNQLLTGLASAIPYTIWVVTDYSEGIGDLLAVRQGSPLGHLLYAITLCGLAIWAAVMKDAEGETRARWTRIGGILGAAAVVAFLWAWLG
jgi:hypothetical protein